MFQLLAVTDVNVPDGGIALLEYADHMVEQTVYPFPPVADGGHHPHAQQPAQQTHIQAVVPLQQVIIHVEGQHHGNVHIQQLAGQVQVALQVIGIHHIDHHIRVSVKDVFPDEFLLGGVIRKRVGTGKIGDPDGIPAVLENSLFGADSDTGVISHMLPGPGEAVDKVVLAQLGFPTRATSMVFAGLERPAQR